MNDRASIAEELLQSGAQLWSAVECDRKSDRFVIYAELKRVDSESLPEMLAESKQVVCEVLERRLTGEHWLATVYWGGRLSYTFAPEKERQRA